MPNHRAEKRWEHPTYRWAYVREYRDAACTVIHGSPPKTTGYKFVPTARTKVMRILDERLEAYQRSQAGLPEERHHQSVWTFEELCREFTRVRFPHISMHQQWMYIRNMEAIPGGTYLTSVAAIRSAVAAFVKERGYGKTTANKVYTSLRTVFTFGVEDGMCVVNPIRRDMVPTAEASKDKPYTDAQIRHLIDTLTGVDRAFVMFLVGTGCRPVEAIRLTWGDVHADYVTLYSIKGKDNTPRPRHLPYALCLLAKFAIDTMRPTERPSDSATVFGRKDYRPIARNVTAAMPEGHGLYGIRKHTINDWVDKRWPEDVRHTLAGHTKTIAETNYESIRTADQLVRFTLDSLASTRM